MTTDELRLQVEALYSAFSGYTTAIDDDRRDRLIAEADPDDLAQAVADLRDEVDSYPPDVAELVALVPGRTPPITSRWIVGCLDCSWSRPAYVSRVRYDGLPARFTAWADDMTSSLRDHVGGMHHDVGVRAKTFWDDCTEVSDYHYRPDAGGLVYSCSDYVTDATPEAKR